MGEKKNPTEDTIMSSARVLVNRAAAIALCTIDRTYSQLVSQSVSQWWLKAEGANGTTFSNTSKAHVKEIQLKISTAVDV